MATRDDIYAAIRNADKAGDAESVRKLAAYLQTAGGAPKPAYDVAADTARFDPASGMSGLEKFNAGAGKAFSDIGLGIKQKLGLASNEDVQESRRLDAPLMKNGAAVAGNIGANVAMLAPSALLPGASTIPGAAVIGGVMGAAQPSASTGEAFANTALGAAGGAGGQWIANRAGAAVANTQAANTLRTSQGAQKVAAAESANKAGYVIPPEDLGGGALTKLASGLGGKIKTAQQASERNQQVTNQLARQSLGMPADAPLTGDTLKAIRQQAGQAYDGIKNTGTVTADTAYAKTLTDIGQKYTAASQAFPGAVKSEIPDLVNALKQPSFSADAAVEMTKILRNSADAAFSKGDKGLGKATREASDALEGMLERHLQTTGAPDALQAFREARQAIARTYTVEKALNAATGDVSAPILANALKRGKPLSGDLRTIAEAGQAFPKAMQALKEAPKSLSPLDWAVAGGGAMTGNPLALGSLAVRPAVRSALLSKPSQRAMLRGAMTPEQANPLLRLMSNEDLALPIGVAGANALSGAYFAK